MSGRFGGDGYGHGYGYDFDLASDAGDHLAGLDGNVPRDERVPIPTPWEPFTAVADLVFRRKVGIVAQRGTAEAAVGRDVAVHAAEQGIPTLLYTARPPASSPGLLTVDGIPHPTARHVMERVAHPPRGRRLGLVVIERYERLRPRERYIPDQYDPVDDPIDDLDHEPPTEADELLWSLREIAITVPLLLTTTVARRPDVSRTVDQWLDVSHPAVVLTEICKPVITLHRTSGRTVDARLALGAHGPQGQRVALEWPNR
ncbi:hypothetical protein ABZY68_08430 [Streptomyces sp. NPDC006482]|uniref:hypothetical protein n=1 Tax=Streptomyces sp. NPDC006482 TaxID=3154306 RepID=UPI0033BDD751